MCEYCEKQKRLLKGKRDEIWINFGQLRIVACKEWVIVVPIHYCPICGRKLEEKQDE